MNGDDLTARAREIAAGLTELGREHLIHRASGKDLHLHRLGSAGGSVRRALVRHGCLSKDCYGYDLTDLGRAVAAILAEVDRG